MEQFEDIEWSEGREGMLGEGSRDAGCDVLEVAQQVSTRFAVNSVKN